MQYKYKGYIISPSLSKDKNKKCERCGNMFAMLRTLEEIPTGNTINVCSRCADKLDIVIRGERSDD